MAVQISDVQREILKTLKNYKATYAHPVSSEEISKVINVTPSYVREQAQDMQNKGLIRARRGPGGGYFINFTEGDGF
ncbi:MAG: Rrf2 family transcriptional regulator [Bacillota bacterium]